VHLFFNFGISNYCAAAHSSGGGGGYNQGWGKKPLLVLTKASNVLKQCCFFLESLFLYEGSGLKKNFGQKWNSFNKNKTACFQIIQF
jgi:hypothetical protein